MANRQVNRKQHVSTFRKGMNKDIDYSLLPSDAYLHAENFRLTTNKNNSTGAFENIKGTEQLFDYTGLTYLAHAVGDSKFVVFYLNSSDELVLKQIDVDSSGNFTDSEIYNEGDVSGSFGYTSDTTIKTIIRYENENTETLYWIDGTSGIKHANLAEDITSKEPDSFSSTSEFTFGNIEFNNITTGSLKAGVVQYAYRLLTSSGSSTPISPLSGIYHITEYSESDKSLDYEGNEKEDDCNKAIKLDITLNSSVVALYDKIRVYSVFRDEYQGSPVINVLPDINISGTTTTFTDRGGDYYDGTITLSELLVDMESGGSSSVITADSMATKDNRLFLANVSTEQLDFSDTFDARAFRFNGGEPSSALLEDSDGNVTISETDSWESNYYVAEDHNCINPFNADSRYNKTESEEYMYQSDGSTLGAEGTNINITFEQEEIILDDCTKANYASRENTEGLIDNYCNPNYAANKKSYLLDEVYRFSIRFQDSSGRWSYPQWIIDLRMPHFKDVNDGLLTHSPVEKDDSTGRIKGYITRPVFTVNNIPDDAVAYQILRAQRTIDDRSIITTGTIKHTTTVGSGEHSEVDERSVGDLQQGISWRFSVTDTTHRDAGVDDDRKSTDLLQFYSPEISIYKSEFSIKKSDKLEVITSYTSSSKDLARDSQFKNDVEGSGNDMWILGRIYKFKELNLTTSFSDHLLSIKDFKILSDSSSYTENESVIGDHTFWPYCYFNTSTEDHSHSDSAMGTCMVFQPETTLSSADSTLITYNNRAWLTNVRRDVSDTRYGGITYEERFNTTYIPASNIKNDSTSTVDAIYGDIYITIYDIQMQYQKFPMHYNTHGSEYLAHLGEAWLLPIESNINLDLRYDDRVSKKSDKSSIIRATEVGSDDWSQMYLFNTVYLAENSLKEYIVPTEEEKESFSANFKTRVKSSDNKINGETTNSWLSYPVNNYIDVDASYGTINHLHVNNNNLLYFQDRAVGRVAVNDRSLVQDQEGSQLVLGSGDLLSRFDYITTDYGCKDYLSVIDTERGLYWFDRDNNSIVRLQRGQNNTIQVINLTKIAGIQSYMNSNSFVSAVSGNSMKFNEVLFTLTDGSGNVSTIVFNEREDNFPYVYKIEPSNYININRELLSVYNNDIYKNDSENANYNEFYGTVYPSKVKLLVNSNIGMTKVFDVINYFNTSKDSNDNLIYKDTFDKIRVYNTYQNSDWVDLTFNSTVTKRGKDWSLHIPRNAVTEDPDTNPDIFNDSNLSTDKSYKERMRDKYLIVELEYTNEDEFGDAKDYRFNIPFVITKYRFSYR